MFRIKDGIESKWHKTSVCFLLYYHSQVILVYFCWHFFHPNINALIPPSNICSNVSFRSTLNILFKIYVYCPFIFTLPPFSSLFPHYTYYFGLLCNNLFITSAVHYLCSLKFCNDIFVSFAPNNWKKGVISQSIIKGIDIK